MDKGFERRRPRLLFSRSGVRIALGTNSICGKRLCFKARSGRGVHKCVASSGEHIMPKARGFSKAAIELRCKVSNTKVRPNRERRK